jgi:hypothetical protein
MAEVLHMLRGRYISTKADTRAFSLRWKRSNSAVENSPERSRGTRSSDRDLLKALVKEALDQILQAEMTDVGPSP